MGDPPRRHGQPFVERLAIAPPVGRRIIERIERQPRRPQPLLQQHQRGHVDQLRRAAGPVRHRHGADRRGVAGAPGKEPAVQHQPAADEGADVEVDEVQQRGVVPEGELGPAGGGGVVLHIDRPGQLVGKLRADIRAPPGGEFLLRRPDLRRPVPEPERHGEPQPGDAPGMLPEQRLALRHLGPDQPDGVARHGEGVGRAALAPDPAGEVDQHEVETAPPDLGAEEVGAVRIERHRHRRLPDPPALRLAPPQQPVGLEVPHDHRDGLRRKPGHPRDLGFRQRPVPPHQAQHQPLVLRPHPGLVRAALQRHGCVVPQVLGIGPHLRPLLPLAVRTLGPKNKSE